MSRGERFDHSKRGHSTAFSGPEASSGIHDTDMTPDKDSSADPPTKRLKSQIYADDDGDEGFEDHHQHIVQSIEKPDTIIAQDDYALDRHGRLSKFETQSSHAPASRTVAIRPAPFTNAEVADGLLGTRPEQLMHLAESISQQKWSQLNVNYGFAGGQRRLVLTRDEVINHIVDLVHAHTELKATAKAMCKVLWKSGKHTSICVRVLSTYGKLARAGAHAVIGHELTADGHDLENTTALEVLAALPLPTAEGVIKEENGLLRIAKYRVTY